MDAKDKPALILGDEVLSHGRFQELKNQVAAALHRDGLRPGDVVVICASTSLAYVATFLGCVQCGVVVAPLAPSSTAEHLAAMMGNAQARMLFTDAQTMDRLPDTPPELPRIALDNRPQSGRPWSDWLETCLCAPPIQPEADWPFNLIYSSGTTGIPKGIMQPFGMRWTQIERARDHGYGPGSI